MSVTLTSTQKKHLEKVLDYLVDDEAKHFLGDFDPGHIWISVRALYIALGYEECGNVHTHSLWPKLSPAAYVARVRKEHGE
jgi:hypothetical protein